MKRGIVVLSAVASLASSIAWAQPQTPPDGKTALLKGPSVRQAARTSLIERESDGSIRRTEVPPEIAALALLELSAATSASIDEIVQKRGRFLDSFIEKNIELLGKLDTANNTGDKLDQALLGVEALAKLAPLAKGGPLKKQIRARLASDDAKKYDAILKEYWDSIVAQEQGKDSKRSRFEILTGERLQSVLRELAAAYERLESSGALLFYFFFDKIELSKEQERDIREMLDKFVDDTKGNATPEQEGLMFFAVLTKLNVKQQAQVMKRVQGEMVEKKKSEPNRASDGMNRQSDR